MGPLRILSSLFPSSPLPPSNYQKPCHSAKIIMLSTLSSSDPLLSNPFSAFSDTFSAWWDCPDPFFTFKTTVSPKPVTSSSGSDDSNQPHDKKSNPSHFVDKPQKPDRDESVMDERKRRRMISNRESARRSRMRKQRHLENLRNQLNKCRVENRELSNRLQFILHHLNRVRTENEWLCSERTYLRQKLYQILVFQQLQPFDPTCMAMQ